MFRKLFTILGTVGIFVVFFGLIGLMGALKPKPERQDPVVTPPTVFYTVATTQSVTLDVTAQGVIRKNGYVR